MTNVKKLLSSAQYRPYTAYNIFFQLEREFILQTTLNVKPTSVDIAFDPTVDDLIPPLPHKYREIVLSDDWYVPGKAQRKKRRHRKSHGKIGFSDLSKQIAAAWHSCDNDVKMFCVEVSDFLTQEYKKAVYKQRKDSKEDLSIKSQESSEPTPSTDDKNEQQKKASQPKSVVSETSIATAEDVLIRENISSSNAAMIDTVPSTNQNTAWNVVSDMTRCWPTAGQLSLPLPSYRGNYSSANHVFSVSTSSRPHTEGVAAVDIQDEDIWRMWSSFK